MRLKFALADSDWGEEKVPGDTLATVEPHHQPVELQSLEETPVELPVRELETVEQETPEKVCVVARITPYVQTIQPSDTEK